MRALLLLVLAATGCATPYAYHFETSDRGDHGDAIAAQLHVADDAIELDVTNHTSDVVQVEWNKIVLDRGDGTTTRLHPASDLGWIQPGTTAAAQLVPVAFPHTGSPAAAYEGRHLELAVPMIVQREPKTYRFHVVVHVQPR
jgi:hypothetical protein